MDRRSFLIGGSILALSQTAAGCSEQNSETLRVQLLKGSVPGQILGEFRQQLQQTSAKAKLDFKPEGQLQDLFNLLQAWRRQATSSSQNSSRPLIPLPWGDRNTASTIPDLVTLGDYWLATAIAQKLIQPLTTTQLKQWQTLSPIWQTLTTRNDQGQPDPKGQVWAAPYRWGSTLIAYRRDLLEQHGLKPPTDWADLWQPAFRDRVSLLDHPREVIGLTLKKLGQLYNTPDLQSIPELQEELVSLNRQVKLYSSTDYLQPLLLGHTWVAVGWSTDVLPLLQQNYKLAAVIPRSGTALWADMWVRPALVNAAQSDRSAQSSLVNQWIDFCWQPEVASRLSLLSRAASPILTGLSSTNLPIPLKANPLLLPSSQIFNKSEFLTPLSKAMVEQYRSLWLAIRQRS